MSRGVSGRRGSRDDRDDAGSRSRGGGGNPGVVDPAEVRRALRSVVDPEIGLDVVTLGLIYEIRVDGDRVVVRHTLTTRGCPMERVIRHGIVAAASRVFGVGRVETELVWEPEWHPGMIDDDAW